MVRRRLPVERFGGAAAPEHRVPDLRAQIRLSGDRAGVHRGLGRVRRGLEFHRGNPRPCGSGHRVGGDYSRVHDHHHRDRSCPRGRCTVLCKSLRTIAPNIKNI